MRGPCRLHPGPGRRRAWRYGRNVVARVERRTVGALHEPHEDLVERWPQRLDGRDGGASRLDRGDHGRGDTRGVRRNDADHAGRQLSYPVDPGQPLQPLRVDHGGGLNLEQLATECLSSEVLRAGAGDEPAGGDEGHRVALLGLGHDLGGHDQGPPGVPQPMELGPDGQANDRIDAARGLVEEHQLRIVDERAAELQPAPHPSAQLLRPPGARVLQLEPFEDRVDPAAAGRPVEPEQAAHEVQVLGDGEVVIQGNVLGHEADPLARLRPKTGGILAHDADGAAGGAQAAREEPDRGRLASAARPDDPEEGSLRGRQRDIVERDDVVEPASGRAELGHGVGAVRIDPPRNGRGGRGRGGQGGIGGGHHPNVRPPPMRPWARSPRGHCAPVSNWTGPGAVRHGPTGHMPAAARAGSGAGANPSRGIHQDVGRTPRTRRRAA